MRQTLDNQLAVFLRKRRGEITYAAFARKLGITPSSLFRLEPVINFSHHVFVKKCMYIVFTFRHYARDETAAKELSE